MVPSLLDGIPLGVASARGLISLSSNALAAIGGKSALWKLWDPGRSLRNPGRAQDRGGLCCKGRPLLRWQTHWPWSWRQTQEEGPPTCGLSYTPIWLWSCHHHSTKESTEVTSTCAPCNRPTDLSPHGGLPSSQWPRSSQWPGSGYS